MKRYGCIGKKLTHSFSREIHSQLADYEYERNLAYANRNISGIETVLLYTLPELSYISSTMVRDLQRHGYDVSPYVPDEK